MTRHRVVVTGGSGFVGRALLARLSASHPGWELVVPTRRLASARALLTLPHVVPIQADVFDPAAMAPLLAGARGLVNLVAVLHGDAGRFNRVHVELSRQLAALARDAGVHRVVHVSCSTALRATRDA